MDPWTCRPVLLFSVLVAVGLAGCATGASPSPTPASSLAPTLAPSVAPSALSSPGSVPPSPSGQACSSPSACTEPSPVPSAAATTCPLATATVALSSDRMTAVAVVPGPAEDVVRFTFGAPQGSPVPAGPTAVIGPRTPPFVADPSGLPLTVAGSRVIGVRMAGMWLYDDAGVPTYSGPAHLEEPGPGVRSIVLAEAFEGYETWLVGFDGPGCLRVGLGSDGSLEIRISHG